MVCGYPTDYSFLLAGASIASTIVFGKLNESNGALLSQYQTPGQDTYYTYIYPSIPRALFIAAAGWF